MVRVRSLRILGTLSPSVLPGTVHRTMTDTPERLAEKWGIPVVDVRLPDGLAGCTDGRTIWVDDRLTSTERHCTIAHELVHIDAGHTGHQSPKVEAWVRRRTAAWLLGRVDVVHALRTHPTVWDAAEHLGVTVPVLRDHLAALECLGVHDAHGH